MFVRPALSREAECIKPTTPMHELVGEHNNTSNHAYTVLIPKLGDLIDLTVNMHFVTYIISILYFVSARTSYESDMTNAL
jgi:hypothetical protein